MKRTTFVFLGVTILAGCTAQVLADPNPQEAIEQAKQAQDKAASLNGGWVTTDKLIQQAEAALAKGEDNKAVALAEEAKQDAELAYAQAKNQSEHWSVPPYAK